MKGPEGFASNQQINDISDLESLGEINPDDIEVAVSQERLRAVAKNIKRAIKEQAPEGARFYANELRDLEQGFAKRLDKIAADGGQLSEEEFLDWEEDFRYNWKNHRQELGNTEEGATSENAARTEHNFILTARELGAKTVEVQAGNFYESRNEALRKAILASDSETKDADLDVLGEFPECVGDHIYYKYQNEREMDAAEARRYDTNRTAAHNKLINQLNKINDLAKKYGTTPFTPRNFWTSEGSQSTPEIQERMRCDRDQVAMYCRRAFPREHERAKEKFEREQGMF